MVETTHEALLRQTATAEELLAYFQGQRTELQADIATSQEAYAALSADLKAVVASELSRTLYVDNTLAEANGNTFPTVKDAVDSLPSRAVATIRLNCGQTHVIDEDIKVTGKVLDFIYQGDLGLGKPVIEPQVYLSGGLNRLAGFSGHAYSVTISTSIINLPTVEADAGVGWNAQKRSLFSHTRGRERFACLQSSDVVGGVASATLGVISVYEASYAGLGLFVVSLDGPIAAVIDGTGGVFNLRRTSVTLANGAALNSGGTIGTNFLQN